MVIGMIYRLTLWDPQQIQISVQKMIESEYSETIHLTLVEDMVLESSIIWSQENIHVNRLNTIQKTQLTHSTKILYKQWSSENLQVGKTIETVQLLWMLVTLDSSTSRWQIISRPVLNLKNHTMSKE